MTLSFTPACLPMLRGGLPHTSAPSAVGVVLGATPDLPAWPALPQRSFRETPLAQAAAGLPGLALDAEHERVILNRDNADHGIDRLGLAYLRGDTAAGAIPADHAAGFNELLRQIASRRPRALKGETLGPVSLSLLLADEHERPLAYDAVMREALLQHLALRVDWQHQQLSAHCDRVLICLDEPLLNALGSPLCPLSWEDGADLLDRLIAAAPCYSGLCVGGHVSWSALLAIPADLVIFDAYEHSADLIQAASAVAAFLDRGGCIGWGIVPIEPSSLAQERSETLASRFERMVEYLATAAGLPLERVLSSALITVAGSLAQLSPSLAEQALTMCAQTARLVRQKYQLPIT